MNRTPLPWLYPGSLHEVLRGFCYGVWGRHKGYGYGYITWKYRIRWEPVVCGWKFWAFWRHPIRNSIVNWKLRNL